MNRQAVMQYRHKRRLQKNADVSRNRKKNKIKGDKTMSDNGLYTLWGIGGYLLGSIPFGLVLCFLAGYGDLRKIGSGNIGATNVLRTGNKLLALLTVIFDASKAGLIAWLACRYMPAKPIVLFGYICSSNVLAALIAGTAAILGHNFPIWLKFKGGKGVASSFGLIVATQPYIAWWALAVWLVMAFTFRYSSLAAIVAAVSVPVITFFYAAPIYTIFYTFLVVLLLVRHHANFTRLIQGKESKIHLKKQDK
jgi:glycerol-3-phosphate acyltransferase PlsY